MSHQGRAVSIIFVTALLLYFYSESVLRQAALSKLKSSKLDTETILSKLPAAFRNSAKRSIELATLKDAVKAASSEKEKVIAITTLAFAIDNNREKEKLFREIIKMAPLPESYSAFSYFLLDARPQFAVSIREYHKYINCCPKISRLEIWNNGLSAIELKKTGHMQINEYLAPLLKEDPPYSDYALLYQKMADIALATNNSLLLEKTGIMLEKALSRPPLSEEINKLNIKAKK